MKKYCPLCGSTLNEDGTCPTNHTVPAMCLNCTFSKELESGELVCDNTQNLEDARQKLIANMTQQSVDGYAIKSFKLDIEPLPLKKPTLKCKRWAINEELVMDEFKKHLVLNFPELASKKEQG